MMFMHSGSPKRALNSITLTPSAVAKKPLFMTPLKWRPCWARRSITALDDRARLPVVGGGHERQRRRGHRQRAHAAGAGPLVAVVAVGVVVGGRREHHGAAVADRLDRELGAGDLLLDQHRLAGPAAGEQLERVLARACSWSARCGPITFTPLPPVRPDGLTATGVEPNDAIASRTSSGVAHDAQPRHRLRRHLREQRARERLVPLDLRARGGRTDRARALGEQRVDHARRQRLVGADHRDVDLPRARERRDGPRVADVADRVAAARGGRVADDRGVLVADEGVQLAVLGHAIRQRALAPAVTRRSEFARRQV